MTPLMLSQPPGNGKLFRVMPALTGCRGGLSIAAAATWRCAGTTTPRGGVPSSAAAAWYSSVSQHPVQDCHAAGRVL